MSTPVGVPERTGLILTNLQSLEFALRLFLYEVECARGATQSCTFDLKDLRVGDLVPENAFTNYDTLGHLVDKVNAEIQSRGLADRVDRSVVELRDALAHGRVSSVQPQGPYRVLKFSKPHRGRARVSVAQDMTPEWLSGQVRRTYGEVQKVARVGRAIGLPCFPAE
jgi:hypothetical protein